MSPPTSREEVHKFLGLVNYYFNMQEKISHRSEILTNLTFSNVNDKCTDIKLKTLKEIKRTVVYKTLLSYPDFNKLFEIHTNASAFQSGVYKSQEIKPIDFYSNNLTEPLKMYTVTEK